MPTARRPMTPSDIRHIVVLEELDLSSDGRLAIVVRRAIRDGRYVSHLLAVPLERGEVPRPVALTEGRVRDSKPRLSPDGRSIAFVRSDPFDTDSPSELMIMTIERDPVARHGPIRTVKRRGFGAVDAIAWAPDGGRLAFTAEVDPPRFLVGSHPPVDRARHERRRHGSDATVLARRITRTDWRWDEEGHLDRWSHLFVLDGPRSRRPRQVTAGDWSVQGIAWHPDSRTIAITADLGPEADLRPRTTIWAVDADASGNAARQRPAGEAGTPATPREIMAPGGWADRPAYSPDGRWLAARGVLQADAFDDVSSSILVGPADGSRAPVDLAPDLDRPIGNHTDTDLNGWMVTGRYGPTWLDERTIVAAVSDRGRSLPVRFGFDPASARPVDPPRPSPRDEPGPWSDATTHQMAASGGVIAALGTLDARAMELMTLDDDAGRPRWTTRTTVGSAWQRRFDPVEMRRMDVPGPGGRIETWIASPAGAGDRRLPTIVDVHGGPLGAWAPAPHIEVTLLAAAGYRVVLPNIRGSTGYGGDWIRPQLGDWGGVDAADVHAALDHVVQLGLADPDRLGALGLSYGGFMVNWLVGTSGRFRAAVSENGVTNQVSDWANSDSGPEYCRTARLGDPLTPVGVERLWRQSPLRHVANVRTPLLLLQAEDDLRCPPQDNEQLFIALRHLGRTVEYLLYPEESHVFASAGRPDRRIDRNQRIIDWFDRYVRDG